MRKRIILCLSVLLTVAAVGAQERNMARLSCSDSTFVDVSLGVSGATGPLKDIFEPEQALRGALDAVSRRKLDKVSLYGRFGYGYDYGFGSTWRGWIDPYETPFMLADSIPGSLSLERYAMEAGAGVPLGGGWSAGLDMAYDVTLMAKHRDLRNKNTAMNFRVVPGVHWQGGRIGLGFDAGFERSTERVEYLQVSSSVEHVLFDLYGLWVYHGSGFASAEARRFKEGNRFFGDVQFDLKMDGAVLHNNLHGSWRESVQTEVGYNNQQFGTTRSWTWEDELSLEIGAAHRLEASVAYSTMQGLRPLQRQELDPDSRIRVWVTYGDPVFYYWRQCHAERLAYTYGVSWKLRVGIENEWMEHSYTEYPQRFRQQIGRLTPSVSAVIPIACLEVAPMLGFSKAYGEENDCTQWQLAEPLLRQWNYWDGDNLLGGLDVKWTSPTGRMRVVAGYGIQTTTDLSSTRHTASLTLGFIF